MTALVMSISAREVSMVSRVLLRLFRLFSVYFYRLFGRLVSTICLSSSIRSSLRTILVLVWFVLSVNFGGCKFAYAYVEELTWVRMVKNEGRDNICVFIGGRCELFLLYSASFIAPPISRSFAFNIPGLAFMIANSIRRTKLICQRLEKPITDVTLAEDIHKRL